MSAIEVKHLTKEYQLGALTNIKDNALNLVKRLQGKPVEQRKRFKALDDINFTIEKGEVVGLIGTNGAGKSTLLKHLARITTPTEGEVIVNGTVAPLIEVGAGFVPDLTGRENIYLNCSIMGMTRKQTNAKIDEIIEFAELEEFIDTPVKRYSSGMAVRLGFSIATSIDADILIIDEVLAVGDVAFQRKCFERIEQLINNRDRTILLVSHNIRQVERICDRAILLHKGELIQDGDPSIVCNLFFQRSNEKIQSDHSKHLASRIDSTDELDLISIEIIADNKNSVATINAGDTLHVLIKLKAKQLIEAPEIVVGIHRTDFVYLTGIGNTNNGPRPDMKPGTHIIEYKVDKLRLKHGDYCIRVVVFDKHRRNIFNGETLKTFTVLARPDESLLPQTRSIDLPSTLVVNGIDYKWNY